MEIGASPTGAIGRLGYPSASAKRCFGPTVWSRASPGGVSVGTDSAPAVAEQLDFNYFRDARHP